MTQALCAQPAGCAVTDRPEFTESSDLIGKSVVQTEGGFLIERTRCGHSLTGPQPFLRYGLSERLEMWVGGDGYLSDRMARLHAAGHSDAELAVKIRMIGEGPRHPAVSLIPVLSMPVGSADFSSGGYDPALKVALGKQAGRGLSFSGNARIGWYATDGDRELQTAVTASVTHDLGRGFGGYAEVLQFTRGQWIANTGITHALGRETQVDIRVGRRLTDVGPSWFCGIGVSVRRAK